MLIATSYSFLLTSRIWTASPCSMLLVIWLLIFSSLVILSLLILWRLYVSLVMRSLRLFIFLIMPLLLCRDLGVVSEAFHGSPLHLLGFEVVALCLFIVSKVLWQYHSIPLVATLDSSYSYALCAYWSHICAFSVCLHSER